MHRTSRTYLPERCSLEEEPPWSVQSALAAPFAEEALVAPSAGPEEMLFEATQSAKAASYAKSAQSARVALAALFAEDALVAPSAGPEEMLAEAAQSARDALVAPFTCAHGDICKAGYKRRSISL
ncbi:hypothetical protein Zm00014a_019865 [Zea mays]|uniref:Uncharacterized protein n=2 Tax=Zea mays TaxID=4577 RepID=A0A1D6IP47_MAIZE|nr:uncharacterized protein LOC103633597 [Zea mays]ONM61028.1 hypothetical protein ZEAMMB73_Zm00001d022566 [Zea mays]PWZ15331.1 hypothetical protein Zm00014a_019865 [Zea mays]|eukprot:XP_008653513.1 uncharacterized protein LOC103633597 [Zea mays]